jgi:cytochrome c oxidase subunit 1
MHGSNATALSLANLWVAFVAFVAAAVLGFYQVAERSGVFPELESPELYFAAVSTHGVLMAFVLTTFTVMGFGYYIATTSLKRPLWSRSLAWTGFWMAVVGVLLAAYTLLSGQASVLYTFYPPLRAHPLFYIGAVLLVVGSWLWCLQMIVMTVQWKRANAGQPVPLAMFGNTANAIMWLWTSAGVAAEILFQLLPWSLGLIETVDVGLARTLFSWTLHAIVYFWLFPAYIAMYTLLPKAAGGRLFSDEMGRVVFIMLMVVSVPIGFHHLYMDPFQAAGFKLMHMFGTFMVALPTLFTGFTILASLEIAGRLRGGQGLFGWIGTLPWREPLVTATILGLLLLTAGGFGGIINASYAMNTLVHNTAWVPGHFHLIFGGTVVLLYFGIAYHLWPRLTGRQLQSRGLVQSQLWTWFVGMVLTSGPWHWLGLMGQPRRISSTPYDTPIAEAWQPFQTLMVVGGAVLLVSAVLFIYNLMASQLRGRPERDRTLAYAEPLHPVLRLPRILNGFTLWNWILLVWLIVAYGYPIAQFFLLDTYGAFPWNV